MKGFIDTMKAWRTICQKYADASCSDEKGFCPLFEHCTAPQDWTDGDILKISKITEAEVAKIQKPKNRN